MQKINSKIHFVIQSTEIKSGSGFATYQKDKDGYYTMPGLVLGKPSRNNNDYDVNCMVECMTNPMSRFYRMLADGNLNGEWGHPVTNDLSRLTKIIEDRFCLFIKKIWTGVIKTGETVVWVKFKPIEPWGKAFEQALEDPDRNANLSIRVACSEGPIKNGVQLLYPKFVVTFDAVGAPGYAEASKRTALDNNHLIGMEDYHYTFSEKDLTEEVGKQLVFMENYNKDSLLEYFKADSITLNNKIITLESLKPGVREMSFNSLYLK